MVVGVWVGLDQPQTIGRDGYGSRYALPIWSDFMRRTTRRRPPESFEPPSGLREVQLCRVSYLRPVEGCPAYTEYFKADDDVPSRLCPVHQGTVKQRVTRAIEGLLSGLGKKLKGIFR
jgi:membrane carboxypeptidase/penicillin-binding protein